MTSPIIQIKNISKGFENKNAIESIEMDIYEGEFFAIVGPSGCGKTTLLRILAGLETPDSGSLVIDEIQMDNVPPNRRPTNMVFQSYAVFPHMTVFENVTYGLKVMGMPIKEQYDKAAKVLDLVKLSGFEKRRPNQLSGGQLQRVALARALIKKPKVLLLDEPLAALDAKLRSAMRQELVNIQKNVGITFVLVTHDQQEALSMADRIAVMNDGRVQQIASPPELYEFPKNKFVADFIGSINLFDCQISSAVGDTIMVTVNFLKEPLRVRGASDYFVEGSCFLGVRPEKIEIFKHGVSVEGRTSDQNYLGGIIKDVTYLGETSMYHVEVVEDETIIINVLDNNLRKSSSLPFSKGEKVMLRWGFEAAILLKN